MEGNGDPVVQNAHTSVEMGSVSQTPSFSRLRLACEGDLEGFQEEMRNHTDPLSVRVEPHHRTPLHLAAISGQVDIVKDILDRLSSPTPSIVDVIANAQKVVNARDAFGYTPLHLAVRAQHEGVVQVLTESPSWVLPDRFIRATSTEDENQEECEGYTPLHVAATRDSIRIVKLLLQQSMCRGEYNAVEPVNIRATTWNGHTALDLAKIRCSHGTRDKAEINRLKKMVETLECLDLSWLQSERDRHANFLNAVLVGAALIAAATFGTWLQPPLGVPADPSPNAIPASLNSQAKRSAYFFAFVTSSFICALQALVLGTLAMMPFARASLLSEVKYLRLAVQIAGWNLMVAIISFVFAFIEGCLLVFREVTFAMGRTDSNVRMWILVVSLAAFLGFMNVYFFLFVRQRGPSFGIILSDLRNS